MTDPFSIAKADFAQCYEALLESAEQLRSAALSVGVMVGDRRVRESQEDCALPRVRRVQRIVCEHFDMSLEQLLCRRRMDDYVTVRHTAIYVCRQVTGYSFDRLASAFKRHHSLVVYAEASMKERMAIDPAFKLTVDALLIKSTGALKAA